jgi:hypothetical protein
LEGQQVNAFERHGIAHLSPSSIATFAAQPALWIMEKLLKKRGPVGCAAHRGSAAEAGIAHGLINPDAPVEDCQAIALREYDRLTALSGDPRRAKERDAVPAIVAAGLPALRPYGVPDGVQVKVERRLEGVPVPVIGFIDFRWGQHGMLLDLKTQLRLSSEISETHARQVALYAHSTNDKAGICYATPQKVGIYALEDAAQHTAAMTNIAQRMERFLSVSADAQELAGIVVPDFGSFWWSDPHTRAMGKEIFGF